MQNSAANLCFCQDVVLNSNVPFQSLALEDIISANDVTVHIMTSEVDRSIILCTTSSSPVISAVDASAQQNCLHCLEAGRSLFRISSPSDISDGCAGPGFCQCSADDARCQSLEEPLVCSSNIAADYAGDSDSVQASTTAKPDRIMLSVADIRDKHQLTGFRLLQPPPLQLISSGSPIDV
jgi:hypothetical protein